LKRRGVFKVKLKGKAQASKRNLREQEDKISTQKERY
jgi:hypothetical protein